MHRTIREPQNSSLCERKGGTSAAWGLGLSGDLAFILGSHTGITQQEEALIDRAGAATVSLSPTSLHAHHCIVLLNWMRDAGLQAVH